MYRTTISLILLCALAVSQFAAGQPENDPGTGALQVFVSILPQRFLVNRIAGSRAVTDVMVPPGRNPATYEPTPRQMAALGRAKLYFTIGVPFEAAFLPVVHSNLPQLKLIATDTGIRKRTLEMHDPEGDHEEEHKVPVEPDPHIWLDPLLMIKQAAQIRDALIAVDPDGEAEYRLGYKDLTAELEGLNTELEDILAPARGSIFFVYHPSFGYFADRYGLRQVAVETGGKEPRAAQLEAIVEHALEEGVKVIFVQPEFPRKSAESVAAAIGGRVVPVEPLREEYVENLRTLAHQIRDGVRR